MKNAKKILALLLCAVMLFAFAACTKNGGETTSAPDTTAPAATDVKINVAAIKGPTGMGMVELMDDEKYNFTLTGDPTEIVALISTGAVDIAACPLNLAANLYKKTNGGVQMIALNTLGVLYIVTGGADLASISELKGKTLYATGQGTTVEYILNYILTENGLTPGKDVQIEYLSEHSELVAKMAAGEVEYGVLPQPFVTAATAKNDQLKVTLSLTEEWSKISPETKLSMGCVIARKDFIEKNPDALAAYMEEYKKSVENVNADAEAAAKKIVAAGILESEAVAAKALPGCNIVFITGEEMKNVATANFEVYFSADPTSIGGAVPGDELYYGA